jgi:hypothetical protein
MDENGKIGGSLVKNEELCTLAEIDTTTTI